MSSGEEFEVGEILEERKRKGVLEYLVHWKGFNELYNSWEPAFGLTDCTKALKAWTATTKRSRSKSRSRSRGRASKSRSRSRSRGRLTKSETTTPKRSRSLSTGRKTTKSSHKTTVAKVESSPEEQVKSKKLRSGAKAAEEKATSKSETTVVEKTSSQATTSKEGQVVQQKTEVVKTTVETVKAVPQVSSENSGMTTRSRVVRQVENDQKPAPKAEESPADKKATWLWWFADHAVLVLFIVVSLIALSFTIESISGVRNKLVPDLGVLRQRLGESYDHFVQGVSTAYSNVADAAAHGFGHLKAAIFPEETAASQAPPTPKQSAA